MTIRAGVIGHPISHSLSPRIHEFWLKQTGIDGAYEAINVPPEQLEKFLLSLPERGFAGVNVTLPHKERTLEILKRHSGGEEDIIGEVAEAIGAVNTVIVRNEKIFGTNTDMTGFIDNIKTSAPDFPFEAGGRAVVLGAGGASRAISTALLIHGWEITLLNRTKEKAEGLKTDLERTLGIIHVMDWELRHDALEGANLLVNTTSLGMKGQPGLNLKVDKLPNTALVCDLVYNPLATDLLKSVQSHCRAVDGLGMLLYQAAPGFEAWFGTKPEVTDALRQHVIEGLV